MKRKDPYISSERLERIHRFHIADKHFILDINSSTFIQIDNIANNILALSWKLSKKNILHKLRNKYTKAELELAFDELEDLESEGFLFSHNFLATYEIPQTNLTTICLNIAQDCNLRCKYCFAQAGTYGKSRKFMSRKIARKAVDFLFENSGNNESLTFSFFGGEPMLNFDGIRSTVAYAQRKGKKHQKTLHFHITTNGTLLKDRAIDYLKKNDFGILVSLDGPPEINDSMRCFPNGGGSYKIVSANLKKLFKSYDPKRIAIRGTFTRTNMDMVKSTLHLASFGCLDVSIEPCVISDDKLQIGMNDLESVKKEYTEFAKVYLEEISNGKFFSFFPFSQMMYQTSLANLRVRSCSAGRSYMAVSADGTLYPCHRFVGMENYAIGNVIKGITKPDIVQHFRSLHVNSKEKCRKCWAKYICGGGCHAYAVQFNEDIYEPFSIECELIKLRIKLGAYIYSELEERQCNILKQLYEDHKEILEPRL